jgi:hypothetical protein
MLRKLAELGYSRSAKKCKEKFENVYKYHKRTKQGRTGKAEGKTYRFFDQLQALENQPPALSPPKPQIITVPLTTSPTNVFQSVVLVAPTSNPIIPPIPAKNPAIPSAQTNVIWRSNTTTTTTSTSLFSSTSTSSSTASDRELKEPRKRSSKRKWKDFFQRLAKEVIEKQEALQEKFLETIEKHESERMVKEDGWRMREMARLNREHEMLIQERSTAAAKDAAVLALLQKISGQRQQQHPTPTETHVHHDNNVNTTTTLMSLPMPPPPLPPPLSPTSSSRWPKAEVLALINLRTVLDMKYQENGPKGPLWEEISAGMRRIGYNRSAKRCKEKWENINKYFKKVKGSNIKRPEDSKTCPYFHQLDALYKEKNKNIHDSEKKPPSINSLMEPLMVQPEQQWPLQEDHHNQQDIHHKEINVEHSDEEENENDGDGTEEEEEDDGGGYEMVLNKPSDSLENIIAK